MKLIQLRSEIFCVPTGSFTILMSLLLSSVAPGIAEVKADRTRLTFRDGGLYCNYSMWHGLKPAKADNMLPAQRAASEDSPWSFYIMQYRGGDEPRATHDGALIREMAKHGKKVILRAHIGRLTKNPDVD
ncbi:MAG: hypothetical protein QF473_09600, partial [Planctomycetota bacterium]|nr:hypothetical protein [Planctomycetota bacterium]